MKFCYGCGEYCKPSEFAPGETRCQGCSTKTCVDCHRAKPLSDFYANSGAADGLQSRCKVCDNARRARHNRGELLPMHASREVSARFGLETSRRKALETAGPRKTSRGVIGGLLIAGYVAPEVEAEPIVRATRGRA